MDHPELLKYDDGYKVSKFASSYRPLQYYIDADGCWICVSHSKDRDGYVKISRNRRSVRLHRYVYEREVGSLKSNEVVMHKCDKPACFNPKHLIPGTSVANQLDKVRKNRQAKGSRNGAAILNENQVKEIYKDSRPYSEIASEYGVHKSTVNNIKRKDSWSHLNLE